MRVIVVGGGKVGTYIASDLAGSHDVVVVEIDPQRVARRQAEGFDHLRWLVADACEVTELERAEPQRADVLIAVTGDDEDNLVISLLAKQEFAVPRVLARVNHPANEWMFDELWGVDVAVSTPHLLTALVEEAVSVGSMVRLMQVAGGRARLVEVTLTAASAVVGVDLATARFPRGSSVVAIVRGGEVVVPRGDTVLLEHDEVLVLMSDETEAAVKALLADRDGPGLDDGGPGGQPSNV